MKGREGGAGEELASWLLEEGSGCPEISPPRSFLKVGAYATTCMIKLNN